MIPDAERYVAAVEVVRGGIILRYLLKADGSYTPIDDKSNPALFGTYEAARQASHRLRDRFEKGARPFVKEYGKL